MANRDALIKRLTSYWKLEAINALLIPLTMALLAEGSLGWLSFLAMAPMVLLLGIGAAYWREKLRRLSSRTHDLRPVLATIARLRLPSLILTVIALSSVAAAWAAPHLSRGLADRVCTTVAALLALLEYVNYYHRQLQHFDHLPDFKRLLHGRGFRRSQMAEDLRQLGLG